LGDSFFGLLLGFTGSCLQFSGSGFSAWVAMALTMMFGLTFGTLLTMVMVPTFYATLNGIPSPGTDQSLMNVPEARPGSDT